MCRDYLSSTLHRVLVEQLLAVDDFLIFKAWQHHIPSAFSRLLECSSRCGFAKILLGGGESVEDLDQCSEL